MFGSATTLNALPGFIATQPVSVTNVTEDLDRRVRLNLPSGVSMLGDPNVEVTVKVNAIESSVTMQITPTLQGLQPGLRRLQVQKEHRQHGPREESRRTHPGAVPRYVR